MESEKKEKVPCTKDFKAKILKDDNLAIVDIIRSIW